MNFYDPQNPIHVFIRTNSDLLDVYRKAGYNRFFDEQSNKLAEDLHNLVKTQGDGIEKCSKFYRQIAKAVGGGERFNIHKQYNFEEQLQKYQTSDSNAVQFIKDFFENLDKLEGCYKSQWNPLPQSIKQEVKEEISALKEEFYEGYNLEDSACELKDHLSEIFDPLYLEEFFGNKREEFEAVVYALIGFREWRGKEGWKRASDKNVVREDLLKAAKLYSESPWMHCSVLTVELLTSILGTYSISRKDTQDEFFYIGRGLIFVVLIGSGIAYFYSKFSIIPILLMVSILYLWYRAWKNEKKYTKLDKVYSEIFTGGYDGETIGQRLHIIEEEGIDIPSIVYPLLKLKHKPPLGSYGRF